MFATLPRHALAAAALAVLSTLGIVGTPSPASATSPVAHPKLSIGLAGKYPPFNFFGADGRLTGFDVDFANELCRRMKRTCDFRVLAWDGIVAAVAAGKIDTVIGSMGITPGRAKAVLFSDPYYESGAQIFLKDPANAPDDLAGLRIGITLGTTYQPYAEEHFPKADKRYYKGDIEVLQDIKTGRLDGIMTDKLVGFFMKREYGVDIGPWKELLFVEKMGIPVALGRTELAGEINAAIAGIRGTAFYASLFDRYFGEGARPTASYEWSTIVGLMVSALGDTLAIALSGLLFGILLSLLLAAGMLGLPGPVRVLIAFWVDFIRATPFLVQLFILYFGLAALGLELSAWTAGLIGIALHSSAYMAEVIKVAYSAVPGGQHDAARTLGLSTAERLRHVIVPQMLPLVTVPLLNTVVSMIKDSAIISVISVHELTMQTQQLISATFKPMELYLLAALLYFAVTYPMLLWGRRLEKRYASQGLLNG